MDCDHILPVVDQGGLRRTVVGAAGIEVVGAAGIEDDQRRAEGVAADILRMEAEAAGDEDSRRRVVVGADWDCDDVWL